MEHSDLLRYVASTLERLAIPYFVTGSTASIAYGEPRFTNDIDVVVDLSASRIRELCASFSSPEYYVSEPAVCEAVALRRQFNIIHPGSGLKIDVIIGKDTSFDRSRFARCRRVAIGPDAEASFASPEDVILKKLEFYRDAGSEKHLRDIAGILKISGESIDKAYVTQWAKELGVQDIWEVLSGPRA
jgi:hypothetical protein